MIALGAPTHLSRPLVPVQATCSSQGNNWRRKKWFGTYRLKEGPVSRIISYHSPCANVESDRFYEKSWKAALTECDRKLESKDRESAQEVNNIDDFGKELEPFTR